MKRLLMVLFISFFILNSGIDQVKAAQGDYQLRSGDVLSISVWGDDEFKLEGIIVREDGKIAFPVMGEVQVAGLSPGELMQAISDGLTGYVKNPQVVVNVIKYHTTRIYAVGEVVKPGLYELEKQHNLMDAIAMAGGYTKDAAKKKVIIISKDSVNHPLEVNLLDLLKKGDMTKNITLKDGDIVYLTDNNRIDFGRDIMSVIGMWSMFRNF